MDEDERALVASLFSGVANPNRVAVLQGIDQERSMAAITEEVDISEQAVRSHAERLVDADLVYRTDGGDQLYKITPFGRFLVQFIAEYEDALREAFAEVERAGDEVRDRFADMNLSEEEVERQVDRLKWDVAAERIEDELELLDENDG